jgi:hypothetical protein
MVAGSALFEVSLGARTGDRCVVEGTYLHGLDHIDFDAGESVDIRNALGLVLAGNRCSCRSSMP